MEDKRQEALVQFTWDTIIELECLPHLCNIGKTAIFGGFIAHFYDYVNKFVPPIDEDKDDDGNAGDDDDEYHDGGYGTGA